MQELNGRIVSLWPLWSLMEVLGVFRTQERALVVIEPPGQPRVGRILEIDDRVDVAVEEAVFKQLGSFVGQSGEFKLRVLGAYLSS